MNPVTQRDGQGRRVPGHAPGTREWVPEALHRKADGAVQPETVKDPECERRYGRGVPGGDAALRLEDLALQVVKGVLSYAEAEQQALNNKQKGGFKRKGKAGDLQEWRATLHRVKMREEARAARG